MTAPIVSPGPIACPKRQNRSHCAHQAEILRLLEEGLTLSPLGDKDWWFTANGRRIRRVNYHALNGLARVNKVDIKNGTATLTSIAPSGGLQDDAWFGERDIERFERFLSFEESTGCVVFTGTLTAGGYGHFGIKRPDGTWKMELAHRVSWVLAGRAIEPLKPYILHNCPAGDNPACCNVDHLWAGTIRDNNRDRAVKNRSARGTKGLPLGVARARSGGRYEAWARFNDDWKYFGVYATWQEAAALAQFYKNVALFAGNPTE